MFERLRARFGKAGRSRKKEEQAQRTAAELRVLYEQFREILAANDATLQTIADVEDRLAGRVPFSFNAVVRQVRRAIMDVFVMVKNLNRMTGGKYGGLYDVLRALNVRFEEECAGRLEVPPGPIVIDVGSLRTADAQVAGTKMANLGEVRRALGFNVPDGFVITTTAYQRFIAENDLRKGIERLEEMLETYGTKVAAEACRKMQSAVLDAPVPSDIDRAMHEAFDGLAGGGELLVAMRSSTVREDRTGTSHAGQYYTELNVGRGWILDAYRSVLSSVFGLSAVAYRLGHGLSSADTAMAVGCLRMVAPRCSGILFSRGFDDEKADEVLVSTVAGLSDGLAGGSVSGEDLTIRPGAEAEVRSSLLETRELAELARVARRAEEHFGAPQDIEWAISERGELFVLQCRPMLTAPRVASPIREVEAQIGTPFLTGGRTACHGCGTGPVFRVQSDQDLDSVPQGAVLVAPHSSPRFSQVMTRCAAIVTDAGSPTGHMSILAREFGVPAIVGLPGATAALRDGQAVTVDATRRLIWEGREEAVLRTCAADVPVVVTPALLKLRCMAELITPLNLVDPASREFTPAGCRSLHDITRFVHEKLFDSMFHLADKAAQAKIASAQLEGRLPFVIHVFDLGGGFADGVAGTGRVYVDEIRSAPLSAFLTGFQDPRIHWDKPRAVSGGGFLTVLGEAMVTPPAAEQGVGRFSFATISDRYMNFSTKAGYHYNTVDTWCGASINKNYIHFRFQGGGAGEVRRVRRCEFLSQVLGSLDFKVSCRGDILFGRLEKYDREVVLQRLVQLGRLTLCARQLDMLMESDDSPAFFAKAFLADEMEKF